MVSLWERVHLYSEKEISSFGSLNREGGKETGDRLKALDFREEMEQVAGPGRSRGRRERRLVLGAANRDTGAGPQSPESRTPALSQNQLGKSRHLSELQFPHLPNGENNSSSSSH